MQLANQRLSGRLKADSEGLQNEVARAILKAQKSELEEMQSALTKKVRYSCTLNPSSNFNFSLVS